MAQRVTSQLRSGSTPRGTDDRSFSRFAGWSGLAATLAFVATIAVVNISPLDDPAGPSDILSYLDDIAQGSWSSYVYGIAGVVLCLLFMPLAVGVYRLFDATTSAWSGSAALVAGLALLIPAYVVSILSPAGLASAAIETGGSGAEALFVSYATITGAADVFFTVGSVLSLGFGPLVLGWVWLRSMESRRWVGWTGVVTGASGMAWFFWLLESAVVASLLFVNVLVSLAFFAGTSLFLLSRGRPAPK